MRTYPILLAALTVIGLGCSNEQPTSNTTTTAASQPSNKDRQDAISELNDATTMLGELNAQSLVPASRLESARCAIVAPSFVKAGFLVAGRHGNGVVTCRTSKGWSGPIFINMTGASGGLQAGVQSADVLMLVMSQRGLDKLFTSGFKLGGDMSVAAGPVGKEKTAGTDVGTNADVLSYARTKGLFAGVDLGGLSIKRDDAAIAALYGRSADVHAILEGRIAAPPESHAFLEQVRTVFTISKPSPAVAEARGGDHG